MITDIKIVKKNESLRIEAERRWIYDRSSVRHVRVRRTRQSELVQEKASDLYSGGGRFESRPDTDYPD
jgi:hypothetical protein